MRLIQLVTATPPPQLAIATDDIVLLRQDGCYLLRDAQFVEQYHGQIKALATDVAQRQIPCSDAVLLTDLEWVEHCEAAQTVVLWR